MNTVGNLLLEHHRVSRDEREVVQSYVDWMGDDYPSARIRQDAIKLLAGLEDAQHQDHPYARWLTRCVDDERLRYVMQLCASGLRSTDPAAEEKIRVACDAVLERIAGGRSSWVSWWPKSLRIPRVSGPSYRWIKKMSARMSLPCVSEKLLDATAQERHVGYRHCFYLLLTRALDHEAARAALLRYQEAVAVLASWPKAQTPVCLSIRLSALYPGLEAAPQAVALPALHAALALLITQAQAHGIALMIEAESSRSLECSLSLMEQLIADPVTEHYSLLGYTVQAYLKVAPVLIMRLAAQARTHRRRIRIRLVKGGYWDEEMAAWRAGRVYACPVFTQPAWTDLSYLRCIYALRDVADVVYAQCATHDPVLWAAVAALMPSVSSFECAVVPELSGTLPHRMMLLSGGALRPCMYRVLGSVPEAWCAWGARFYGSGRYLGYTQELWKSVVRDPVHEAVAALATQERLPDPPGLPGIDVQRVERFKPCVYAPPRSVYPAFLCRPEELQKRVPSAPPSLQQRLASTAQWICLLERDAQAWIEAQMAEGREVSEAIRSIQAATALCRSYLQETREAMQRQVHHNYRYQCTRPRSQVCVFFWEAGMALEHLVRPLVIALCAGVYVRIYASQSPDASAVYVMHALLEAGISKEMLAWVVADFDLKREAVRVVYLHGSQAALQAQYARYGLEEVPVVLGVRTDAWHVCISEASSSPEPVVEHMRVRAEGGSEKVLWCCHDAVYDAWVSAVRERCSRTRALQVVGVEELSAYSELSEGVYVLRYQDRALLEAALAALSIASLRLYTELLSEVQFWLERPWSRVLTLGDVPGRAVPVAMPRGIVPVEGGFSDVARCMDAVTCLGEGAIMSLLSDPYSSEPAQ